MSETVKLSTRERVLEAGIRLWIDTEPAVLYGGMNVSRLAKAAGVTRATVYSYWSTTQEFLDDLAEHIAARGAIEVDGEFTETLSRMSVGGDDITDDFLALCRQVMEQLTRDPSLRLRLGMLSKMDDPVVAAKLRARYAASEDRLVALYEPLLERWGRAPRPPIDLRQITALFTALMEGYAARAVLDPDLATPDLYAYTSVGLLLVLTTTLDNDRDLPTLARMMNRWAEDGERIRAEARARGEGRPRPFDVDRPDDVDPLELTRATRRVLAHRTWAEITFDSIAPLVGADASTLARLFGSKHGLGIAVFQLQAREAFDALPPEPDPLARLRLLLGTAAEILRRSPAITQSVMLVFAGMAEVPAPHAVTWDATGDIFAAIADAQAAGQLSDEQPANEVGAAIIRTLLTQLTPVFGGTFGRGCDSVELVLRGLGATPSPDGTTNVAPRVPPRDPIPTSWAAADRERQARLEHPPTDDPTAVDGDADTNPS